MDGYTINIIVHDLSLADPVKNSLNPLPVNILNGHNYPSFSKLCNDVIVNNPTEIVIICSYKSRPTPDDITKMLNLINDGYGIVALYRYAFFGFRKELIRRVGFFDERFIGGGYEDCDMLRRILLNNIAQYEGEEIKYIPKPSTWNFDNSKKHFFNKWLEKDLRIVRLLDEETYNYDIGNSDNKIVFLKASDSYLMKQSHEWLRTNLQIL
jgi:GT2 family glycosyltransferase